MWKRRIDLQIFAVLIIIAAMLKREYSIAGQWLAVATICVYLASGFVKFTKIVRNFSKEPGVSKTVALIYLIMAIICVNAILTHSINFFLLIILLAIEFLCDSETNKEDDKNE